MTSAATNDDATTCELLLTLVSRRDYGEVGRRLAALDSGHKAHDALARLAVCYRDERLLVLTNHHQRQLLADVTAEGVGVDDDDDNAFAFLVAIYARCAWWHDFDIPFSVREQLTAAHCAVLAKHGKAESVARIHHSDSDSDSDVPDS
jgi:hypothetical protein